MTADGDVVFVEIFIEVVMRLRIEIADVIDTNTFCRKLLLRFLCDLPQFLLSSTMVAHDKDVLETVDRHAFDHSVIDGLEDLLRQGDAARRCFTEPACIHSERQGRRNKSIP